MHWLSLLNRGLLGACLLSLTALAYAGIYPSQEKEWSARVPEARPRASTSSIGLEEQAYQAIGTPFLDLKFSPAVVQIPDLRAHLVYHGRNGRPDLSQDELTLQFSLKGSADLRALSVGQRVYLRYIREKPLSRYVFSENNEETGLWITAQPSKEEGKEALVSVGMKDMEGHEVLHPVELKSFSLTSQPRGVPGQSRWQLGEFRVDASLLARMRARWFGQDRFLEWHGGEEYGHLLGKERVDFGEGGDAYPRYVGEGDVLVWKEGKWEEAELGTATQGLPLLQVKKISERVMNLELWDEEGIQRTPLTLVKSRDMPLNPALFRAFRFVGAKTHSQAILEINANRLHLNKHDWLVFEKNEWRKLESIEEIDNYVSRRQRGELFVYDGITRREGRQVLAGHVFNAGRTEAVKVEFAVGGGMEIPSDKGETIATMGNHDSQRAELATKAALPENPDHKNN